MSKEKTQATYRLRFFFDYGCGGCLWSDNDAAYEKYDVGTLDAVIYDPDGNVLQESKIKLPEQIRQKVLELDTLFSQSLDWNDPAGDSLWDKDQWNHFFKQTQELYKKISQELGDDFEVIYKQE
jgi:hypothetical protein